MSRVVRGILIGGAVVVGLLGISAVVGLCPPQGPWPMPPWCSDEDAYSLPSVPSIPVPGRCAPVGGWPEPPERSPVDIYSKGIGQFLLPDGEAAMTATENGWSWNLDGDVCDIELTHHHGAQFISEVSLWNHDRWLTLDDLPEELSDAYVRDLDGEPMTSQGMVFLNLLDPAFRDWLATFMREQIDLGVDGFVFDETSGTAAAVEQGAGIDHHSIPGFRAWLVEHGDPDELRELGIEDLSSFDYGAWLEDRGLRGAYEADFSRVPLGWEFHRYHWAQAEATILDLIDQARAHGREQGRELLMTANITFVYNFRPGTGIVDALDLMTFEHSFLNPQWRDGNPWARIDPSLPVGPAIRWMDSTGRRTVVLMSLSDYGVLGTLEHAAASRMVAALLAETYANLGFFAYFDIEEPWEGYHGPDGRPVQLVADRDVLVPHHAFIRRNPLLFNDLTRPASVAIAHPPTVDVRDLGPVDNSLGYGYALGDANVVFDVVDVEGIGPHDVVLTGGHHWSDTQVQILLDHAAAGATVILTADRFATLDLDGRPVDRPELDRLRTPGTHVVGDGTVVALDGAPGWDVHAFQDPQAAATIVGLVTEHVAAARAPDRVQVLPYVGDGRLAVHLLNRDGRDGVFVPKRDLPLEIPLPDGFDPTGMTLTFDAPEASAPTPLEFEIVDGWLRVQVPSLELWAGLLLTR